ncbi:MAG: exostosin family protein [Nostoc sp.]|uniref:exostosin domain-containing protein n=1 Tax=Nostoc sp. TaxID=1180 RepID=UPI002FF85C9C
MRNTYEKREEVVAKQLHIYSDRCYLPEGIQHIAMLYPFWGKSDEVSLNPMSRRYNTYIDVASDLFKLTQLENAQIALLPFDWSKFTTHPESLKIVQQMSQETMSRGIPLVVFYLDDATTSVELDNALVFRTSINRSTRLHNESVIPAWSEDFVENYCQGKIPLRSKSSQPIVGYCGYGSLVQSRNQLTNQLRLQLGATPKAADIVSKFGIELVKHDLPWLYGSRIREQALFILSKSRGLQCNFRIHDVLHHTEKLTLPQREQFVDNMLNSDYILCTRGGGNFSYRFYETLSCGRIPVFINTDCELPFEQYIDWKRYCIWVEEADLPYLGDRIREFHARLTPQQFQDLQIECRKLWLEWLSPEGFFANFHRYF